MSTKPDIWKRQASKYVADCRVFKVREDFCERESDAAEHTFFVIENPDWVNVVALDSENQVVLIEQFRHGTEEIILEIPGGIIDAGETPEAAARRELLEETGYAADEFVYLGKARPNPAIQNNWIYYFAALNCRKIQATAFDEHESVVTRLVSLDEIPQLIDSEQITHSLVLNAFHKFDLFREANFKKVFDVDENKSSAAEDFLRKVLLAEGYENPDAEQFSFYIANILRAASPLLNRLRNMNDSDIEAIMEDIHALFVNKHSFDEGKRILMWENKEK